MLATVKSNAFSVNYQYSNYKTPVCTEPGRFPHHEHCHKYFECDGNSEDPAVVDCPTGLHYSAVLETCVLPDYADCNVNNN